MCEKMTGIRLEALDVDESAEKLRPVIDAAFAAADDACCATRKNAVSRAVFEAARDLGYRVAWGDVLATDGPDFYVWPVDTRHAYTVARVLEENRAHEITARDFRRMAVSA